MSNWRFKVKVAWAVYISLGVGMLIALYYLARLLLDPL